MYAVRINPNSACKPKVMLPGAVWLKEGSKLYRTESERSIYKSVADANAAKTQPWEIVVKVEVEK